jgi:hypothetical protein
MEMITELIAEIKKPVKTWWLKTHDNIDVCGNGKGRYSLEQLPGSSAVEFREGQQPIDEMEILGREISKLLGLECHWVRGQDIYG